MKKLNMGRLGLTFCLVSAISISSAIPALADWQQNETGWWYEEENGNYIKTDWKLINGKWYYFGEDGYLYTNKVTPDGYKVDKNGEITEKLTERETEITTAVEIPETETTVPETTPKSTEYVPVGGWSNEEEANNIGTEIQEAKGWNQNPVRILSNYASYGDESPVIELSKTGDGYEFKIKTKLAGTSEKGFQALCYLICYDDTLFNYIMSDYENEILQNDTWTKTEYGFSIMVHTESGMITYSIKLD